MNKVLRPADNRHALTDLPPRPVAEQKPAETIPVDWLEEYHRTPAAIARNKYDAEPEYRRLVDLYERGKNNDH
jgi:hypothetical protein